MKISNSIYTKREADELLAEIEEGERNSFRLGRRPSFSLQELESVKKALAEALVLGLTVAVKPSPAFLAKIGRWLRDEIDQRVVLDIKVDPLIIAGAIISFEGKYLDLSAGKRLGEWFEKHKSIVI